MRIGNYLLFLLFALALIVAGCEGTEKPAAHSDLSSESPDVVEFNYKLNFNPDIGNDVFFPFTVRLKEIEYIGSDAEITFMPGMGYNVDGETIEFAFDDKDKNLIAKFQVQDDSEKIKLNFKGKIKPSGKEPVEFDGFFLITPWGYEISGYGPDSDKSRVNGNPTSE